MGCRTPGCVEEDVAVNFSWDLGFFLCEFGDGSWTVGACHDPQVAQGEIPAGCFLSIIILFASFAQIRCYYCHQKKPFGEKKKKKKVCHYRKHLLSHFFLLSCHLLSSRSDATGFSQPFSWHMPEPGRWVGSKGAPPGSQQLQKAALVVAGREA